MGNPSDLHRLEACATFAPVASRPEWHVVKADFRMKFDRRVEALPVPEGHRPVAGGNTTGLSSSSDRHPGGARERVEHHEIDLLHMP